MNPNTLSIWRFIYREIRDNGCPPTEHEIGAAVSITHVAARNHVKTLARLGKLEIIPQKARGIRKVVPPPDTLCPCCGGEMRVFAPFADHPGELSADCWAQNCDLHGVTLPLGDHALLSNQDIQGYRRARLRSQQMHPVQSAVSS